MAPASGIDRLGLNLPMTLKTEAKGHPRSGGNRLLAPSIAFDYTRILAVP